MADRGTDFGLESRSSLSKSAIELENDRLRRGYSGYTAAVRYDSSRAFGISPTILRFLGGRILKRIFFGLSMTGYVIERIDGGY